jgi:peptide/nickel transport system ATP-binding protein
MLIKAEHIYKIYKTNASFFHREKEFNVLNDISFSLDCGNTLSIIGESGSGKTTLAKILSALIPFDSGMLEINGKKIQSFTRRELSQTVQMIFQNPYASFNPKLTIGVSLSQAFDGYEDNKETVIKDKLFLVGLEKNILDKYPHQFSGGQRQRIAIARALLKNPEILIADEPFASLDAVSQTKIMDIFLKIKKEEKTNIIFITHDVAAAMEISDKILILKDGCVARYDSVSNIDKDKTDAYVNELLAATYMTE